MASDTIEMGIDFTADEAALAGALARLPVEGAVALPLIGEAACQELLAACARLAYRPARPLVGQGERAVQQDFEICMTVPPDSPLRAFAGALERLLNNALRRLAPPPLDDVVLNDFAVQRYRAGSSGISPHRDHLRYRGLVVLVNLVGRGRFFICDNRAGDDARELPDYPGCLLLMRQPPFAGLSDRPFHFLKDISEPRVSLGLRHDTRPGEPS